MYRQEQAEAEKMYQKEVGKSAELVERLKEGEREQVCIESVPQGGKWKAFRMIYSRR